MSKCYAVVRGRVPGFYSSWPACQNQIKGYSKACYKSFSDKKEAALWMQNLEGDCDEPFSQQLKIEIKIAIEGALALKKISSAQDFESSEKLPTAWSKAKKYEIPKLPAGVKQGSLEFFNLDRDVMDLYKTSPELRTIVIYCDGSKMPTVNHFGSGVYCRLNGTDYGMSLPFSKEVASKYCFTEEEISKLSSPTMEYLAFSETLWSLISIKLPLINGKAYPLAEAWRLLFVCDFIGVQGWTNESWQAKESHIIKIKTVCSKILKFLADRNIHVQVQHCDGHADFFGNELADLYAKSQTATNNLDELVYEISKVLAQ